jgi:hypothetical protein
MLVALAYVLVVLYNAAGDPLAFVLLGITFCCNKWCSPAGYGGV